MWVELIEQGMAKGPEALIPVTDVLDIIQRSIVLIGNASNLVLEIRREIALEAIHPSLKKYAEGDFKDAGSDLFGDQFKDELVKKVEQIVPYQKQCELSHGALRSIRALIAKTKGKILFFRTAEPADTGPHSEGVNTRTQATIFTSQSRGKFTPGKPYLKKSSVFE